MGSCVEFPLFDKFGTLFRDDTLVNALARAHRGKRLLGSGGYQTVQDLVEVEKINPSQLACVLRLTLLAPDIVEEILDGAGNRQDCSWMT